MEIKNLLSDHNFDYKFIDNESSQESYVSKDLIKSATVENLISQNEDLMSRLKVGLRRLATLEDLNQDLQTENFQQTNQILNYADQVQVLKEKDLAWKSKVDELEQEKEKLAQMSMELESIKTELERHKKYHDKVRYQVKPYIQNLKASRDEAIQNEAQIRRTLSTKESQLADVRHQMQEILRQSKNQVEEIYRQKQEVVAHLEKQIQELKDENARMDIGYAEMLGRIGQMNVALEKKAEFENKIIELERSKQDIKLALENEVLRLQQRLNEQVGAQTRLEIENTDLKRHIEDEHSKKMAQDQELISLRRQMESLRFMWNQKNEEALRNQKSLEALEKLNQSLSEKIQELRTSDSEP